MMKDIPGYEGRYAATTDGRIWSHRSKKFLASCGETGNYQLVMLCVNNKATTPYVHRLVAMTFLPNPDNLPEVNHINMCRDDNRLENLEWCTKEYNLAHRNLHLKAKPVRCIELNKSYRSLYDAAKSVGGNPSNLAACLKGRQKVFAGYHWEYEKCI